MRFVLRVAVPDQPGSLHALTGVCARADVDIVSLDVIARSDGRAVDDLCVTGVDDPTMLRDALEGLEATTVLSMRPVDSFRDTDGAIALAAALVAEGRGAVGLLVQRLPDALWASWAVAVARGWNGLEVLGASPGALAPDHGQWLPMVAPRHLAPTDLLADVDTAGDLEVAAAPLGQTTSAVIVARDGGPRFVDRELRQLDLLAKVAVATEVVHSRRRPVERIDPPRRVPIGS
jgi:hypothetical protein